MQSLSLNH